MARIVILGCTGSGKTLARQLGQQAGAPVICLDSIWRPHWTEKAVPAFRSLVKKAQAGDEWISDGNFAVSSVDIRLPLASLVIWLERPRLSCAWSANSQLAFTWNFDQVNRPRMEATRLTFWPHVPILRLSSRRDCWLSILLRQRRRVGLWCAILRLRI